MRNNLKRKNVAITHKIEKKLLDKLAKRVYKHTTADQLSGLAFLGTFVIFVGYWFAGSELVWLHLVSLGLIIHWFGDSLDGRVAVLRGESRPKYGHYLDHILDVFTTVVILTGIHLSGLTTENFWLYAVVVSLFFITHVHLRTSVTGVFDFTQNVIGPTEIRIMSIMFNLFILLLGNRVYGFIGLDLKLFDWAGLIYLVAVMIITFRNIYGSLWGKERIEDG